MTAPRSGLRPAILAALLVLGALLLRLPGLDRWPPAIHQDEASNGVDGWSLLTTGADRAGRAWPVFLEGFGAGDNRTSLYAFLTVPGIVLFGPGTVTTRLPAALLGAMTVLAVFLFMRRIRGPRTACFAALLLATNPWHLTLSRFGHEASLTPFFLITALWLVSPGESEGPASRGRWIAAGLILGLGLYSYPSYRLFLPAIVLAALLLDAGPARQRRGVIFLAALLVAALPLVVASVAHPERLAARTAYTSVLGNVVPLSAAIQLTARQYAAHFLPAFLFVRGDGNPLHSPPGGQLLWVELAPLLVGVVVAIRRRDRWDRLFLLWLVLYPIASASTLGDRPEYVPHSLRAAVGLPVFELLGAQGIVAAIEWLGRSGPRLVRTAWIALGIALAINLVVFAVGFTGHYSITAAPLYHAAYPPAVRYLAQNRDSFDAAVITCEGNPQAYIYSILYGLQTPRAYQAAEKVIDATETFHLVRRAGDLFYVHEQRDMQRHSAYLRGVVWAVVIPGQMRAGRVLERFAYPDGIVALEVRELEFPSAGLKESPSPAPRSSAR